MAMKVIEDFDAFLQDLESHSLEDDRSITKRLMDWTREMGIEIKRSNELPNYLEQHPVKDCDFLIELYQEACYDNEKDFLLQCLVANGYEKISPLLLQAFKEEKGNAASELPWSIGDYLYTTADPHYIPDYLELIADPQYGDARQMVILIFEKIHDPSCIETLISLLDDPDVNGHALEALSRYRTARLLPYFRQFTQDEREWVRKIAKRYVRTAFISVIADFLRGR